MKRRDVFWITFWFLVGLAFARAVVAESITGPAVSEIGTIATLATDANNPTWHIQPDPPPGAAIIDGQKLYLTSAKDVSYMIGVTYGDELVMHLLAFGSGGVVPPPTPPTPDPPQPPTPLPGVTLTVIVEESSLSTQAQRQTMVALAQWMNSQEPGIPYRMMDQDAIAGDNNPPTWAPPILDAIASDGDSLPVIVFMAGDEVLSVDPLPIGDAAIDYVKGRIEE